MNLTKLPASDILIAGAGLIGLSLALELHSRGAQVTVLERDKSLAQSSTAAAGMLASKDPFNPEKLFPLSNFSIQLYPAFLERIERLSGIAVPFQTETTIQYLPSRETFRLEEHSVDPRQLATALLAAVRATSISLVENTGDLDLADTDEAVYVRDSAGKEYAAAKLVHANGSWFRGNHAVRPRKGQMLRVQLPSPLREVHRAEHIYIVPRTTGPQAGTAIIGATLEDVGYDTTTHTADLHHLRALAAELLPQLASEVEAPQVESWAGLRPGTIDDLPLLGALPFSPREFAATGHFRNGILLAPATAHVMADLLESKLPTIDLTPFSPERFNT